MTRSHPCSTLFPYTTLFRSLSVDQLHDLGWQTRLEQDLHQQVRGVGHVLGRLEDHRIPAQERGEHLPRRDRERSEEHTSELQSRGHLVCRLLLEKKKQQHTN